MKVYYNDNDKFCCAWLREIIAANLIPAGEVDERSIFDVEAGDVRGYGQCHFFAGIGGWPLALKLAGWPEGREVWTGSCPCQPLSCAGQRKGHADERHLWPAFYRLISECKPTTVFGEQVSSKDGREWLAGVRADLEGVGYAVGGADLCAASLTAPHRRQRLFWVADASSKRTGLTGAPKSRSNGKDDGIPRARGTASRLDHSAGARHSSSGGEPENERKRIGQRVSGVGREIGRLADANGGQSGDGGLQRGGRHLQRSGDEVGVEWMGDTNSSGRGESCGTESAPEKQLSAQCRGDAGSMDNPERDRWEPKWEDNVRHERNESDAKRAQRNFWSDAIWIPTLDPRTGETKMRRISPQPALFPLAARLPGRVGMLRGAGNAIVPQVAAEFVKAFLESER